MKDNLHYDIIICGGGASGLLLAHALIQDEAFDNKQIALIEKEDKTSNDRTWSFWEKGSGPWDHIIHQQWNNAIFSAPAFQTTFSLSPYTYKTLQSKDFYAYVWPKLQAAKNLTLLQEHISNIRPEENQCWVNTDRAHYNAKKVFSSLPVLQHTQQSRYPVLQQHFIGWFVKTQQPIFDPTRVDFMDFDLPQKGNTRFMYVLPFSSTEALVEYTLFSKDLLTNEEYEQAIRDYLQDKDAKNYSITATEQGSIPMTAYDFSQHNTTTLLHIGTAGGWTKASTGYTFQKSVLRVQQLLSFLKTDQPLNRFRQRSRFDFYDLLFLDVLAKYNAEGSALFLSMFQKNPPERIFRFLEEKTHWREEVILMRSFPVGRFLAALIRRIFGL